MSNHPVHIIDSAGEISPSSFIPFCQFGFDMNLTGENQDNFSIPVCTIFRGLIHRTPEPVVYDLSLYCIQ